MLLILGIACAGAAAASHSATHRHRARGLIFKSLSSPPPSIDTSGSFSVQARVGNEGKRRSPRRRFSVYLVPLASWQIPMSVIAHGTTPRVRGRRSALLTARLTVPSETATAPYDIYICLGATRPSGRALRQHGCVKSRYSTVVLSTAPGPWNGPATQNREIEGYTSQVSSLPGETVEFHVSTLPAERYRIDISRLGWYGGSGGQGMTCLPSCTGSNLGTQQPMPSPDPQTGETAAGWPVTDRLAIPTTWPSGVYVARMVLTGGPDAGQGTITPFVVRSPPGRSNAILVDVPVNTWEAYNHWGGKSLYPGGSTNGVGAVMVSFDRPYAGVVNRWPTFFDTLEFLEREGYQLSYTTDVDIDRDPASLRDYPLVIVAGHAEYWTSGMRTALEAARDAGVNLAFFGGNIGFWQMRYADNDRTIVEYRSATKDPEPDPSLKTVQFRQLQPPRPECELLGVEFHGADNSGGQHNLAVVNLSDPWMAGTGFNEHSTLNGLAALEWDSVTSGCATPPLTVFFRYSGKPAPADITRYTAPSGARVLSLSSLGLPWGLSDISGRVYYNNGPTGLADPRLQRFVQNALDSMGGRRSSG